MASSPNLLDMANIRLNWLKGGGSKFKSPAEWETTRLFVERHKQIKWELDEKKLLGSWVFEKETEVYFRV